MSVTTARSSTDQQRKRSRGRGVLRAIGWMFITGGVLILLFVVYQLFVTNVITDQIQDDLRQDLLRDFRDFQARGVEGSRDDSEGGGTSEPDEEESTSEPPIPGGAVGILRIPDIELDVVFVEGVTPEHLKRGPGHYPTTPLPGEGGNVGIAGHRTTYAKPFWALNELENGDQILVRTREGRFVYEIAWTEVVGPGASEVLDEVPPDDRLTRPLACADVECITLTTCHPRFSAAQRLIVRGVLVEAPRGVEVAA